MTDSLRALLSRAIDYAGLFPPASLSLEAAHNQFRHYRSGPNSWMLGRFVVPAARLSDLAATYALGKDGGLTVAVPSAETVEGFFKNLDTALFQVRQFPDVDAVRWLELRWPVELMPEADESKLRTVAEAASDQVEAFELSLSMYFELPAHESSSQPPVNSAKSQDTRIRQNWTSVHALNAYRQDSRAPGWKPPSPNFKVRCGGTGPADIPSSQEVASVICACRELGICWKATAGLHHPMRHMDPVWGVPVHGFLNLFCATVIAQFYPVIECEIEAILEVTNPKEFRFTDGSLAWQDYQVQTEKIRGALEQSLDSFGSCSFEDPCEDLTRLGLLP